MTQTVSRAIFAAGMMVLAFFSGAGAGAAESRLLQMPYRCQPQGSGLPPLLTYTGNPERYPLVKWGGEKRFNGREILRYLVDCGGQVFSAIDIYMAAPRDEQAYVRNGYLYIQSGSHNKRILVQPERCRWEEHVEEYDPPDNPCYHDIMDPACDPERRFYRTVRRRVCSRPEYGYRRVPDFTALPSGYAPRLPDMYIVIRR